MLTWNMGVERHDSQRVFLDCIVEKPGASAGTRSNRTGIVNTASFNAEHVP